MKDFGPERLKTAATGTLKDLLEDYEKKVREFCAKELKRMPGVDSVQADALGALTVDMANGDEWEISVEVTAEDGHIGTTVGYWKGRKIDQLGYWKGTRLSEIVMDMKNILLRQ